MTSSKKRVAAVLVVLVGALAFLLAKGLGSSLDFYETASQAVAQRHSLGTTTFNLEGVVVAGSVRKTARGADFEVSSGRAKVSVVDAGTPPAMFAPGIPVVLVGHFLRGGSTFWSNQMMVKHSATYIEAHPGRVRAPDGSVR